MINEVYNCDCMQYMKTLPDKYFELAIVDPPYGIGDFRSSLATKIYKKIEWNKRIPDKKYFNELYRISKNRIIFGVNYYLGLVKDVGRIIHDKTGGGKRNNPKELSNCDIASHSFGNNMKIFHYIWIGNVQGSSINWNNEGADARIHPCQKPIELYKWILQNYAKKDNKIFDSHVGSGSLRIACYELGFDFIGCELDSDYWEAQENRFKLEKAKIDNKFYLPEDERTLFN